MWPSPEAVTLTVHAGSASSVSFPVRPPRPEDDALRPFEEPEVAQPLEIEHRSGGGPASPKLAIDRGNGRATLSIVTRRLDRPPGRFRPRGRASTPSTRTRSSRAIRSRPRRVPTGRSPSRGATGARRVNTASVMTSDTDSFLVTDSVEAFEGDRRIFARSWTKTIPRDHI